MSRPKWTVLYNIVNGTKWVGTGWEFFDTEDDAATAYKQKISEGHCPTKRPFHKNDNVHLGAAHRA
jgi:hypothetical protein